MSEREALEARYGELMEANASRKQFLDKLWGLGLTFPDADIKTRWDALKSDVEARIQATSAEIERIECRLYMEESA